MPHAGLRATPGLGTQSKPAGEIFWRGQNIRRPVEGMATVVDRAA